VFALNGSFRINEKISFRGGIDNLLDKQPLVVEAIPGTGSNADTNTDVTRSEYYDILGRRYYIGLSMKF